MIADIKRDELDNLEKGRKRLAAIIADEGMALTGDKYLSAVQAYAELRNVIREIIKEIK